MNELYELTLESQDIQLIVTEGIVSGHLVILLVIHLYHSYINSFTF